jgi:16S rRNA (adenine1518-N6/adenine1519-N6)-dimethyltransferase
VGDGPQGKGEIVALLAAHGVVPRKALGQHFLADPNIVRRIVDLAGVGVGSRVVEIGAGTGTLTRALCDAGAAVVAYEVDGGLRPLLEAEIGGRAELRFADAAAADLAADLAGDDWTMVANLPYGVGTPLLLDAIAAAGQIRTFVVMVQREVADRLVAKPGSKVFGLPSVTAQLYCDVRFGFAVGRQVFVPPPNVDSAVLRLDRTFGPDELRRTATRLAATAFGQRRKMLRSSLRGVVDDAEAVLGSVGIDPRARPEDLEPQLFLELARAV